MEPAYATGIFRIPLQCECRGGGRRTRPRLSVRCSRVQSRLRPPLPSGDTADKNQRDDTDSPCGTRIADLHDEAICVVKQATCFRTAGIRASLGRGKCIKPRCTAKATEGKNEGGTGGRCARGVGGGALICPRTPEPPSGLDWGFGLRYCALP